MKSVRSWIAQQSIVHSIFIVDKRTDVTGIVIEPVFSSLHVSIVKQLEELRKEPATPQ